MGIGDKPALQSWDSVYRWGGYEAGTCVRKGDPLFPRIDLEKELEALAGLTAKSEEKQVAASPEDQSNLITIDDFAKVELRVVQVKHCEPVPDADKLLKLILDAGGDDERQVVSGIAKYYTPEEMVGKKLILVSNLKPAVLRGIESQGMILAATKGKKLSLVTIEGDLPPGSKIS